MSLRSNGINNFHDFRRFEMCYDIDGRKHLANFSSTENHNKKIEINYKARRSSREARSMS